LSKRQRNGRWPVKRGIPTMQRNRTLGWNRFRRAVSPHHPHVGISPTGRPPLPGQYERGHPCRSRCNRFLKQPVR
jgi:hypothetical protein